MGKNAFLLFKRTISPKPVIVASQCGRWYTGNVTGKIAPIREMKKPLIQIV